MKPDIGGTGTQIDRVVLIDLGINYLYTNRIRVAPSRDVLYVAPEVRDERPDATSDMFSVGCILIDLLDPDGLTSATVPDSIYRYAPEMARFIEDLIDADPQNRLLLFGRPERRTDYVDLLHIYIDQLRILPSQREVATNLEGRLHRFSELYTKPSSGQIRYQWQSSRLTRKSHPAIAQYSAYLFVWTAVCAFSWYLTFLVCVDWAFRDVSLDNWAVFISVIQKVAHSGETLPLIDDLRASDYHIHDWRVNLPVRILGLCTGVAMTKYYQNVLGALTVRKIRDPLARVTEFSCRLMSFWILPPMLAVNLWEPRAWPWIPVAASTFFCHRLAVRCRNRARLFSAALKTTDPSLEAFGHWTATMVPYIFFLFGIAIGLQLHILHDVWLYAAEIAGIHLIIHYVVKCTLYGPQVRGSLARAFTAGERAEALDTRRARQAVAGG
jgi:hypothetical protein